jgi:hypothetical protein
VGVSPAVGLTLHEALACLSPSQANLWILKAGWERHGRRCLGAKSLGQHAQVTRPQGASMLRKGLCVENPGVAISVRSKLWGDSRRCPQGVV